MTKNSKDPNEEKSKKANKALQGFVTFSQIGWTMAASIIIGVFVGNWLDNRFSTNPLFLIVFSILGVIAAIRYLFELSKK